MRQVRIDGAGGPEVLRVEQGEIPVPGAGELLIKVAAAGLNRADIVQRMGFYPPPPGAPEIPGLEVAGTVAALGEGVDAWAVGDRVCALLAGGGYAEYAVARAAECLPVPAGLTDSEAASLPEALMTVWSTVVMRAGLQPGEALLVHGGSSGIGTAAIQIGKLHGCRVYTTAGSAEKVAFCTGLGADLAINYREADFVAEARAANAGNGMDVILDMVGGDYVQRNIDAAAVEGRIVNIAFQQGAQVQVNLMPLMLKRLTLTGATLRAREPAYKAMLTNEVRQRVWPWVEKGDLRPVVFRTFPLEEVAGAHALMESSAHIGKIILQM
jgi:putative PIG3 family NAD(P)H quinone oxidoreductase